MNVHFHEYIWGFSKLDEVGNISIIGFPKWYQKYFC